MAHPADPVSEAFRVLRSNLGFMDVDRKAKTLMVTSSVQGEGKSVLVANLAVTLALAGKRVIVVDADLRRPRQHRLFELSNDAGASTVTAGDSELEADAAAGGRPAAGRRRGPRRLRRLGRPARSRSRDSGCSPAAPSRPTPARSSPRSASRRSSPGCAPRPTSCSSTPRRCWPSATPRRWPRRSTASSSWSTWRRRAARCSGPRPISCTGLPCAMMGVAVRLPSGGSRQGYYYSHYRYADDGGSSGARRGDSEKTRPSPATDT